MLVGVKSFKLSGKARHDLLEIWAHIADDNEAAAERLYDKMYETFGLLAQQPRMGRRRDELRRGIRTFPVGEYLIVYRVISPGVRIVRVVHGRRNLTSLLH
jgi:toxin ParE1/3/4